MIHNSAFSHVIKFILFKKNNAILVYINFLHTHILLNIVVPQDLIYIYISVICNIRNALEHNGFVPLSKYRNVSQAKKWDAGRRRCYFMITVTENVLLVVSIFPFWKET